MKYIEAEKLIAEIERRIEACRQKVAEYEKNRDNISASIEGLEAASLISFRSFIDSFQQEQPQVDLEKEIKNYLATKCAGDDEPSVSEIARHFYELGLNTRKEETK